LTAAVTGEYERAETFAGEAQKMHRETRGRVWGRYG
jgi:hypothetical protein